MTHGDLRAIGEGVFLVIADLTAIGASIIIVRTAIFQRCDAFFIRDEGCEKIRLGQIKQIVHVECFFADNLLQVFFFQKICVQSFTVYDRCIQILQLLSDVIFGAKLVTKRMLGSFAPLCTWDREKIVLFQP